MCHGIIWRLYLLFTLVLDSLYHRLISMPPEMSIASPPWNSALALRPDCRWMTWRPKIGGIKKSWEGRIHLLK